MKIRVVYTIGEVLDRVFQQALGAAGLRWKPRQDSILPSRIFAIRVFSRCAWRRRLGQGIAPPSPQRTGLEPYDSSGSSTR